MLEGFQLKLHLHAFEVMLHGATEYPGKDAVLFGDYLPVSLS